MAQSRLLTQMGRPELMLEGLQEAEMMLEGLQEAEMMLGDVMGDIGNEALRILEDEADDEDETKRETG